MTGERTPVSQANRAIYARETTGGSFGARSFVHMGDRTAGGCRVDLKGEAIWRSVVIPWAVSIPRSWIRPSSRCP